MRHKILFPTALPSPVSWPWHAPPPRPVHHRQYPQDRPPRRPRPRASPLQPAASPALTETFTSNLHGISVLYPEGWVPRAATEPWPADDFVQMGSTFGDVIEDGSTGDTAFLALASQPLAGRSLDEVAAGADGPFTECGSPEPPVVDGAPGIMGSDCPMALVAEGDRVFLIGSTGSTIPNGSKEILATVQSTPEAALDTAP